MNTMTDNLAAIVLNYCQYQETLGCVRSLTEAGLEDDQIVVIDNASPDGSGEKLAVTLERYHFLQAQENGGYGPGNNLAINYLLVEETLDVEYFFILNPDVRVLTGAVGEVVRAFESSRTLAGVSCVQWRSPDCDRLDPNFEGWLRARGAHPGQLEERSFVATHTLLGAAMVLSREALLEVGGFDPLYFLYAEEEDLARRFRYHGFDIGVATDAHVVHSRPYSENGESRQFQRRTSRFLYKVKDPFGSVGRNLLRAARFASARFVSSVRERDSSLRDWVAEMAWVAQRVPTALRHRYREMKGAAHLDRVPSPLIDGTEELEDRAVTLRDEEP